MKNGMSCLQIVSLLETRCDDVAVVIGENNLGIFLMLQVHFDEEWNELHHLQIVSLLETRCDDVAVVIGDQPWHFLYVAGALC